MTHSVYFFAPPLLLLACGGSATIAGAGGGGAGGGSTTTGTTSTTTTTSGYCESFVSCCDDATGEPVDPVCPDGGEPECPPGSSWPPQDGQCKPSPGKVCSPQKPCDGASYCDYPDELCGAGSDGGCKPRPKGCDAIYVPVCNCAGKVSPSDCNAYADGFDVSGSGGCADTPQGMFPCGAAYCFLGQYCRRQVSDVGGYPDEYSCHDAPGGCPTEPTCACLANEVCGEWCEAGPEGGVTLTCPGG